VLNEVPNSSPGEGAEHDETLELEQPLVLRVSKSQSEWVYPVVYERDFSFTTTEMVLPSDNIGCTDELFSK
jgi:hypothetical protein